MAMFDSNWWFGPNSILGKLFGKGSKPAPTPQPTPVTPASYRAVAVVVPSVAGAHVNLVVKKGTSQSIPFQGSTNGDGYVLFTPVLDGSDVTGDLVVTADGFLPYSASVSIPAGNQNLVLGQGGVPGLLKPKPVAPKWTKNQLLDFQGDLMVYMPELGSPAYTGIKTVGDNGATAHGLVNGWIWTLWLPWYNAADRQKIYAKVRDFYKWTHIAIQVCEQRAGDTGYHGLRPITQADSDGYGALMNIVHQEIIDAGLIPVAAGVAPGPAASGGAELAKGFDASKVLVAMTDWDNTSWAAERIKKISDTFPNAWLFYERPGDKTRGCGIDKSPNDPIDASWPMGDGNGGQWIANMQRVCPRFVGVLYEVNNWPGGDSVDVCAAEIQQAHDKFWRDVQEVRFETNTYEKFWGGEGPEVFDALDAQLQVKCAYLKGFMSGGAAHAVIQEDPGSSTHVDGGDTDMIPAGSVSWVAGVDISQFAVNAKLTKVSLQADDVYVEWTGSDSWPEAITPGWSGPLQYSMGICFNIGGQWYGSAPIEAWKGKNHTGGPIQADNVEGSGIGQLPKNWFYNSTWGKMQGYQPKPGEVVGFFLACGDCRNQFNPTKVRTQIVTFKMPAPGTTAVYTF